MASLVDELYQDLWHSCALWTKRPGWQRFALAASRVMLLPRVRAVLWIRLAQRLWRVSSLRPVAYLIQAHVLSATGAEIHPAAAIGPGLNLAHTSGIVIGKDAVIGRDLLIFQNVTIGDGGSSPGQPVLGDRVRLGAGAKVLGPLTIGDDAIVGANAVVLKKVDAGDVVVGIPARVVANHQVTT